MHSFAVALHVVTAILGLGQIAGMAVVASSSSVPVPPDMVRALERLVRASAVSLAIMLLTGLLIAYLVGFEYYGKHLWLRASFLGTIVVGAINGSVGRTLKRRAELGDERALKRVTRSAWVMCALLAAIATLMELKPT